jgi:maltooligosyltrehalose trehalohydrolase
MTERWQPRLGAFPERDGVRFRIWAPGHERLEVVLYGPGAERLVPMQEEGEGYRTAWVAGIGPGGGERDRVDGDAG